MQILIKTFSLALLMVFSLGQMTAQDQLKKPKDQVEKIRKAPQQNKAKSVDQASKELDEKGDVVRDQAREVKGKGKGKAGDLKDRANQDVDKVKKKAGETRDRANQEVDKVKMKDQKPEETPANQGEVGVQKQKERRANDGVDVKTKPGQSIEEAAKAQSGGKKPGNVTPRPGSNKGGGNVRALEAQSQVAAKKKAVVQTAKKGGAVANSAKDKIGKAKAKNDADYKAKKIDLAEYESRKERIRVVEEKTKELESTIDQSQKSIED